MASCILKWLSRAALALLFAAGAGALHAQRFPFYNIGIENGLIQSQVTCLAQDSSGHLWIGTLGGLSRFDGHSFTNYSVRDGLLDNGIQALAFAPDGALWIGSTKGVSRYDGRQFRHYAVQPPESPASEPVVALRIDAGGTVWCVAAGKLYAIRQGSILPVALPPGKGSVTAVYTDRRQQVWMGRAGHAGLYRLRGAVWDSLMVPASTEAADRPFYLTCLYEDRSGGMLVCTNRGLFYKTAGGDTISPYTVPGGGGVPQLPVVLAAAQARDGSYWLATGNGAYRLSDSSLSHYSKRNGLTDNTIMAVLTDAEGAIWMGSDGQGLYRFSGAPFTALDESMGLPSSQIMAIAAAADGTLYLGTYDAGLYARRQDGSIHAIPFPDGNTPDIIAMAVRRADELWIGTRGAGLWLYRKGRFTQYTTSNQQLPSNFVTLLRTDAQERLWIGFLNGVVRYEEGRFVPVPLSISSPIQDLVGIGGDSLLLATDNGLRLYSGGRDRKFLTHGAADSATVQCFVLRGDALWMGSSDNGAIRYNLRNGRTLVVNRRRGLLSEFVYNITTDAAGAVWAGTGNGIYRIQPGPGETVSVRGYGKQQGVTGIESNHNAVLNLPDGSIWFGTTGGAMHYRPDASMVLPQPRRIVLQSVKLYGEDIRNSRWYDSLSGWYGVPEGLRLPPDQNNLSFTFRAPSLTGGEDILYRYRIEDLEAGWSDWSSTNTVTYSALPSGKHRLLVQGSTDGKAPALQLAYPFEIITPFHKTGLFRLIVIGGCVLLGVSLQYAANRRRSARRRQLEALRREEQAKVRQRTAEDFHDEVGNKLTRINVLANVLKAKTAGNEDAARIIGQIQEASGQLYSGTRDILWSLKPSNDSLYEVLHRIRDFGGELFGDTEIRFHYEGTEERWREVRLPMDVSRNLIMIFKEALNNALKYSGATEISLKVSETVPGEIGMRLQDNGRGFDPEAVKKGNGIANMNIRSARIRGRLSLRTATGEGTELVLRFRVER